jgi:anti-sigma B factor antagonist
MPDSSQPTEARALIEIDPATHDAVVRCSGRLVLGESEQFHDDVRALIPGSKRIVLDLEGLTHMDSSGLGTVVRLYVAAKAAGCDLQLINLGKGIRKILSVANLLSFFTVVGEHDIRMQ